MSRHLCGDMFRKWWIRYFIRGNWIIHRVPFFHLSIYAMSPPWAGGSFPCRRMLGGCILMLKSAFFWALLPLVGIGPITLCKSELINSFINLRYLILGSHRFSLVPTVPAIGLAGMGKVTVSSNSSLRKSFWETKNVRSRFLRVAVWPSQLYVPFGKWLICLKSCVLDFRVFLIPICLVNIKRKERRWIWLPF